MQFSLLDEAVVDRVYNFKPFAWRSHFVGVDRN